MNDSHGFKFQIFILESERWSVETASFEVPVLLITKTKFIPSLNSMSGVELYTRLQSPIELCQHEEWTSKRRALARRFLQRTYQKEILETWREDAVFIQFVEKTRNNNPLYTTTRNRTVYFWTAVILPLNQIDVIKRPQLVKFADDKLVTNPLVINWDIWYLRSRNRNSGNYRSNKRHDKRLRIGACIEWWYVASGHVPFVRQGNTLTLVQVNGRSSLTESRFN